MTENLEKLKDKGLKITPQRIAIVELLSEYGHLSISKLYDLVKQRFPSISLATIYKNVNTMVMSGYLKEVKIIGEDSRYELNCGEHSHLFCKKCGKVEDIELNDSMLKEEINQKSDFLVDSSFLVFYGYCKECQED